MEYKEVSDAFAVAHGALDWIESKINRGWISRLFAMKIRVKWYTPPVLVTKTYEVEEPFRYCRAVSFHVLPRHILVFGVWSKEGAAEHEVLLKAVRAGRETTTEDIEKFDDTIARERPAFDGTGSEAVSGIRTRASRDAGAE